ncbi:DoxX family membrane protein [Streptomyces albiaxialis]|uniref:DoxX family membrane protein n=1 Tax=Streptomyces albiaxialis TaxID=329523 RepID=A0ABP5HNY8_9ACTN
MNSPDVTLSDSPTSPHTPRSRAAAPPAADSSTGLDTGLLVIRLVVGLSLAAHGTQKLFGWFDGNGLDGTEQFFASVGYPSAGAMAVVAGLTEALGGLGLALGLLTPLAGAAVLGTMINAIAVTWDDGYLSPDGFEYAFVLAAAAGALALTGPGRYAVDRALPVLREHRVSHGVFAVTLAAVTATVVLLMRS